MSLYNVMICPGRCVNNMLHRNFFTMGIELIATYARTRFEKIAFSSLEKSMCYQLIAIKKVPLLMKFSVFAFSVTNASGHKMMITFSLNRIRV